MQRLTNGSHTRRSRVADSLQKQQFRTYKQRKDESLSGSPAPDRTSRPPLLLDLRDGRIDLVNRRPPRRSKEPGWNVGGEFDGRDHQGEKDSGPRFVVPEHGNMFGVALRSFPPPEIKGLEFLTANGGRDYSGIPADGVWH